MSKQRWNREEGNHLIEQWRQSGQDKLSFCKEHKIAYSRFLYWCKILDGSGADKNTDAGFVTLAIESGNEAKRIYLHGPNGLQLCVYNNDEAVRFVKALLSC